MLIKRYFVFIFVVMLLIATIFLVFFLRNASNVVNIETTKTSLYNDQAKKICEMLNQGVALYQAKQFKKAHTLAENAYWNVYDNILEIKYRPYVTPEYIFNVEDQFHQFSNTVLSKKDKKTVSVIRRAKALCKEVSMQAVFLTEKS